MFIPKAVFVFVILNLALPLGIFASEEESQTFVDFDSIATDEQMLDSSSSTKSELTALLSRGALGKLAFEDVNGLEKKSVDIIWDASQKFSINPRFITVLLQREQSLVEDPNPSEDQLDWAMGYSICDSCSKSDPVLQKYKGFANQVYFAAKRIRESYLTDLQSRGFTESGIGPGIEISIDGEKIVPQNFAT
jgi:hypothetical protein